MGTFSGWPRSDVLALIGIIVAVVSLLVTVGMTWIVYRLSARAGAAGDQAMSEMRTLQGQLTQMAQRTRRDELRAALEAETNPAAVALLVAEAEQDYAGNDLALLRATYRQNLAAPLPRHGSLDQQAFEDYVAGIAARLRHDRYQTHTVVGFAAAAARSGVDHRYKLAQAAYAGSDPQAPLGHTFYRELVRADWHLAAHLVHTVSGDFDWENPARSTNALTGVFVGLIDIDPRTPRRNRAGIGAPLLTDEDDALLQAEMLQALAGLMHYGPLTGLARIDEDKDLYARGSTEPLTALVAWLIRAAGNAVQGDAHLEMRVMESLAPVADAVKQTRDWRGGWGIDAEDVQVGLLRMRHKCPDLWDQYGEDLVRSTRVPLEPLIQKKRPPLPTSRTTSPWGVWDDTSRWPEIYETPPDTTPDSPDSPAPGA